MLAVLEELRLTMNNEDLYRSGLGTWDVYEVDMILSESHNW